jgi:hypothetical protein
MGHQEKARNIIAQARETLLSRLDAGDSQKCPPNGHLVDAPDGLAAWSTLRKSRQEPKPEQNFCRSFDPPPPAPADWAPWEEWVQARIQAAIERERAALLQTIGEFIGETQAEAAAALAYEKRALSLEIGELRLALSEAKLAMANASAQQSR